MQYLRCKCGNVTAWSSMGTYDCEGCSECQTTLAAHPNNHRPLQPHKMVTSYNQNTGKPYKRCANCGHIDDETYKQSKIKDDEASN